MLKQIINTLDLFCTEMFSVRLVYLEIDYLLLVNSACKTSLKSDYKSENSSTSVKCKTSLSVDRVVLD